MHKLTMRPEREDARYSLQSVKCPNVPMLGHSKTLANSGDLLVWRTPNADGTPGDVSLGRVLGRVDATGDGKGMEAIRGWIVAIALSEDGTFAFERWVDPAWVTNIHPMCPAFYALFAGGDPEQLLRMSRYGSLSASALDYRDGRPLPRRTAACTSCGHDEPVELPLDEQVAEARYTASPHLAPEDGPEPEPRYGVENYEQRVQEWAKRQPPATIDEAAAAWGVERIKKIRTTRKISLHAAKQLHDLWSANMGEKR